MKNLDRKIKLIFIPFILITIGTVGLYTFLHWLLIIELAIVVVNEEIIKFFIPFALPWIPLLIWLRPRINLLQLKNKTGKGDPLMAYLFFAWIIMAVPTIIAQEYLVSATGKLTRLDNINQIGKQPITKYYTLKRYYIDKKLAKVKSTFEVSGKYSTNFDMTIYVPCPIFEQNIPIDTADVNIAIAEDKSMAIPSDIKIIINGKSANKDSLNKIHPKSIKSLTVLKGPAAAALYGQSAYDGLLVVQTKINGNDGLKPAAWLAVKYQRTISNKLSPEEKEREYNAFVKQSQAEFEAEKLDDFIYLDKVGPGKQLENYTDAIKSKEVVDNIPIIILSPVNKPYELRNGNKFAWIFGSFGIGSSLFLIALLFKPLKNGAEKIDIKARGKKDMSVALIWVKSFIIPNKTMLCTQLLIQVNILIFILMAISGLGFISFNTNDLFKLGANYRPSVIDGQYWRLFTSIFLHGGIMHILFNMYGLLFVGVFLEPLLGRIKYAIAYLVTGLLASIASIWWHPATVSVGASGAIFGLYGVFFALLTTNLFPKDFKKSFLISTSIFIGFNLLYGLMGNTDNVAHVGGLLSGLLIGYMMYPGLSDKANQLDAEDETQKLVDEINNKGE